MRLTFAVVVMAGLCASGLANAQSLEDTAARFGIRQTVLDISLSPSGDKIAFVSPGPEHSEVVKVVDLASGGVIKTIASNNEQNGDITQCEWVTDSRLVCQLYGMTRDSLDTLVPFTRMFSMNADGSQVEILSERRNFRALGFAQNGGDIVALDVPGEENRILMTREHLQESSVGTRLANSRDGLGVDLIDVVNGRRKVAEQPDSAASRYLADENGVIRLKVRQISDNLGYLTGKAVSMYRPSANSSWERLKEVTVDGRTLEEFTPVAVDAGRNVIYGHDKIDGFDAIIEVAMDGSGQGKVVMSRNDVDVDTLIRIGRQRRVVGASYATEKREIKYFDPGLSKVAGSLAKALPNHPLINIVGSNADESKLLIIASSDTDPGMIYLFNRNSRQLEPLFALREYLAGLEMGKMTPISFTAADGTQIPAYLTLPPGSDGKNLPGIVLPHGGPAARDEWGFDWLVQFLVARGYAVLQPNYRGSAGFGEDWYGRNGYQSWHIAISDVMDAGKWLVREGIARPDRLAIAGWSYGGYAALQSQVVDPGLFKAVVAIAPVTDLEYLRSDSRRYTSYKLRDEQIGEGEHVAAGSPLRHADRFAAPVALFHGTEDVNVDVRHSQAMAKALQQAGKQVSYTQFEGLEHSLADSRVRTQMLIEIDQFLGKSMGR